MPRVMFNAVQHRRLLSVEEPDIATWEKVKLHKHVVKANRLTKMAGDHK